MSDTTATGLRGLVRRRVPVLVVLGLVVLAYVVGTRFPHTTELTLLCDTTATEVRCETEDGLYLRPGEEVMWRDGAHAWRSGRPDCLRGIGEDVGPVTLGVVEGGDDGLAWRHVVWAACP